MQTEEVKKGHDISSRESGLIKEIFNKISLEIKSLESSTTEAIK